MLKVIITYVLLVCATAGLNAQQVEVIKIDQLEHMLDKQKGITIVNFWASWCAPCVKELPDLYQVYQNYQSKDVHLLLISLDFADQKKKALQLLQKKNIRLHTYLLDETNYNSWIDRIEPRWQGAIPMTLIYRDGKKVAFINQSITYEQIAQEIETQLKP